MSNMLDVPENDFSFVLEPGKYWFVLRGTVWNEFRPLLKDVYGAQAFRVAETNEQSIPVNKVQEALGLPGGTLRKVLATYIVLEVKETIAVPAGIMGAPHGWHPGDNAQSVGAFEVPEPSWIVSYEDALAAIKAWAEETYEDGKAAAGKVVDYLDEKHESILDRLERTGKSTALLLGAGLGLGYLAYRVLR